MLSKVLKILGIVPRLLVKGLIYLYQYTVSPILGKCCRFYPTCSDYALEAFSVCGFWKGLFKTLLRVAKCSPWHPGGYDPVVCKKSEKSNSL